MQAHSARCTQSAWAAAPRTWVSYHRHTRYGNRAGASVIIRLAEREWGSLPSGMNVEPVKIKLVVAS